jgi:L-ascorbate metabolism protein UlaG (beta-lactamase superfamily)
MVHITLVGGPTAVVEIGGLRLVTDPTFDAPGSYPRPGTPPLVKLTPPALGPDDLGRADAVLLSHDQHSDNLDRSGRAYLERVPLTLTTVSGAARLAAGGLVTRGLAPWEVADLTRPDGQAGGQALRVTAVPARHGPEGCEPISGEVTGFVLTAADLPTVYVSGDNAWLGAVSQVADRFGPVDIAILFAGAARIPERFDRALLTLDSALSAAAAGILRAAAVVPVHYTGWSHFTEGGADLRGAFERAGMAARLVLLAPGESADLSPAAAALPGRGEPARDVADDRRVHVLRGLVLGGRGGA